MNKVVLCVAPHPDDETLGCGGALLRHRAEGDSVHWFIATAVTQAGGFSAERIASRAREIEDVAASYGFAGVHRGGFPTAQLDQVPKSDLVGSLGSVIKAVQPNILYVPYRNDVHSDHAAVFDAAMACSKSFRYPSVRAVYAYETLSETEFGIRPDDGGFRPNLFVDVSPWMERKIEIMRMFAEEMGEYPFPRSERSLRALATLRGGTAGCEAAEGFMILKEVR
ncbi:PIG-L deacetylase family protein [Achromobacter animicus]